MRRLRPTAPPFAARSCRTLGRKEERGGGGWTVGQVGARQVARVWCSGWARLQCVGWAAGSSRRRAKCGWAEDSGTWGGDAWVGPGSARKRTHHLCSSPCTPGAAPCPKACSMKKKKEEWETTAMRCSGRDISHCERVHRRRAGCERRRSGRLHRRAGWVGAAQQWAGVVGSQGGMEGKEGERRRFKLLVTPAAQLQPGRPRQAAPAGAQHPHQQPSMRDDGQVPFRATHQELRGAGQHPAWPAGTAGHACALQACALQAADALVLSSWGLA